MRRGRRGWLGGGLALGVLAAANFFYKHSGMRPMALEAVHHCRKAEAFLGADLGILVPVPTNEGLFEKAWLIGSRGPRLMMMGGPDGERTPAFWASLSDDEGHPLSLQDCTVSEQRERVIASLSSARMYIAENEKEVDPARTRFRPVPGFAVSSEGRPIPREQWGALKEALTESSLWNGQTLCRFHPDVWVELEGGGEKLGLVQCFSCREAILVTPEATSMAIVQSAQLLLRTALRIFPDEPKLQKVLRERYPDLEP